MYNTGEIIGIVLAGLFGLAAVAGVAWAFIELFMWYLKNRK
jgi:hypothetical protein